MRVWRTLRKHCQKPCYQVAFIFGYFTFYTVFYTCVYSIQALYISLHDNDNDIDEMVEFGLASSQINLSLGQPPNNQWFRHPGRPRNIWVDQIRRDNNLPPADLWRHAVNHGHRGVTLRLMPAMH